MIPQYCRLRWVVVTQDRGKERAKLATSLHVPSLLQALIPFTIILQEASSKTGSLVGWILHTIEGSQILPVLCTLDNGEQGSKVEALPSRWMDKVHATNCKSTLSWLPVMPLSFPDKVLREVLIEMLRGSIRIFLIGLEPFCQMSLLGRGTIQDILGVIIVLEVDLLFILKMNW